MVVASSRINMLRWLLVALFFTGARSFFAGQCGTGVKQSVAIANSQSDTRLFASESQKSNESSEDDLLQTPAFLKKKIEVLQKQIAKKEEEIEAANAEADKEWEEWGPQIERLEKEFSTVKIRMLNDTMEASNDAKVKVLTTILGVNDNFQRASQAISPSTEGEKAVVDFYKAIYEDMQQVFTSLGMEPVPTVGHPFDYNVHEAVMRQPSDQYEEDIVCLELTKGYTVGDSLIRPALVAVSSG